MEFMIDYLNGKKEIVEATNLDNAIQKAIEKLSPECNNCDIYACSRYKKPVWRWRFYSN